MLTLFLTATVVIGLVGPASFLSALLAVLDVLRTPAGYFIPGFVSSKASWMVGLSATCVGLVVVPPVCYVLFLAAAWSLGLGLAATWVSLAVIGLWLAARYYSRTRPFLRSVAKYVEAHS